MSNRIDPMQHGIINKSDNKVTGSGSGAKVQSTESTGPGKSVDGTALVDTVVLTGRSQLLERLEKTAASLPVIDRAKVDAVKADIAEGNYHVDVDNIADLLLRSEQELGDLS